MKKRIVSLLLALVMVLSLVPMSVFAADNHDGQVHVIVENTTYPEAEGAPWEGTLVEEWIDLNEDSTMMGCIVKALERTATSRQAPRTTTSALSKVWVNSTAAPCPVGWEP